MCEAWGEGSLFLCHGTSGCEAGKSSWLQDSGLLGFPSTASVSRSPLGIAMALACDAITAT